MAKPALGRGLGALLGGGAPGSTEAPPPASAGSVAEASEGATVRRVSLRQVQPCAFQPRKEFSEDSIRELADSIREQGIVQPLIVRQRGANFELIAGERRWRAAQLLQLSEVPVIVREADDRAVLELALIENLQRENLTPLEEAQGYSQLIEQFELKQEEVAARVGKSRAAVANALRLLKLAPEVQERLRQGKLSVGHAKVVLGLSRREDQAAAAEKVIKSGLNVRQTEELIARIQSQASAAPSGPAPAPKDPHVADLEDRLKQKLGTKVALRYQEGGKGAIEIRFFSDDDLGRLLQLMGVAPD